MLVSIIVPFYNVEPYFRRCLDSIVNQTYRNLEIILVNDCSPDNSIAIAREYAAKDDRIIIIEHEKNLRQGGARNSGLAIAKGEYIWFMDSDDEINGDEAVANIVQKIHHHQHPDIVHFSFYYINKDQQIVYTPLGLQQDAIILQSKQELEQFSLHLMQNVANYTNFINSAVHVKVFKREFLVASKFAFPVGSRQSEDSISLFAMFAANTHLVLPNAIYYRYYYIPTSTCNRPQQKDEDNFTPYLNTVRALHAYHQANQLKIKSEVLDNILLFWVHICARLYQDNNPTLLLEADTLFKAMIVNPKALAKKLRSGQVTKDLFDISHPSALAVWLESFEQRLNDQQRLDIFLNIEPKNQQKKSISKLLKKAIKMLLPYGVTRYIQIQKKKRGKA